MRFHVGKVPPNDEFQPQRDGWRRMQEPGELAFFAQATLTGIVSAIAFSVWIGSLPSTAANSGSIVIKPGDLTLSTIMLGIGAVLGGFVVLIIVHESIHLLAHPKNGLSRNSIVGILPTRGAFYAFYDGQMTRNRFVLMAAAPFIFISVVPAVVFTLIGQPPVWLGLFILANALFSGWRPCCAWTRPETIAKTLLAPSSIMGRILETSRTRRQITRIWPFESSARTRDIS